MFITVYQVSSWDLEAVFVAKGLPHFAHASKGSRFCQLSGYASVDMSEELGDALGRLGTWGVPWPKGPCAMLSAQLPSCPLC